MKNFELYNPVRVIFGNGESEDIGRHVAGLGKKALVVSYGTPTLNALRARAEASLKSHGIEVVPFYCITANPLLSHIREAVEICRARGVDFCIAIGGGSVMDATKAIAAGVLYEQDLWKMFVSRHDCDVCTPPERSLPTVMIPTLSATSSEMNCIAVATNDETKEKA